MHLSVWLIAATSGVLLFKDFPHFRIEDSSNLAGTVHKVLIREIALHLFRGMVLFHYSVSMYRVFAFDMTLTQ